jgi:dolichyl-phosphate-mannose-protein mannosyltransferase
MGSVLGAVKVSSPRLAEFSTPWWLWLGFTGTMLACCISVKFVGLFVVLLVGLMTIADLWNILGDMSRPVVSRREPNSANIFPTTITNLHGLRLGF